MYPPAVYCQHCATAHIPSNYMDKTPPCITCKGEFFQSKPPTSIQYHRLMSAHITEQDKVMLRVQGILWDPHPVDDSSDMV